MGALKEREKVFPTGLQIDDKGVAIPHTDMEHVNRSAIAIASLKNPVSFYQMGTSPDEGEVVSVKLVIMLAITGGGHMDMLQKAIMLIQDLSVVDKLMSAKDGKEIIQIIKEKEEQL